MTSYQVRVTPLRFHRWVASVQEDGSSVGFEWAFTEKRAIRKAVRFTNAQRRYLQRRQARMEQEAQQSRVVTVSED